MISLDADAPFVRGGKPGIRAYAIGAWRSDVDLFYTLATALGEESDSCYLALELETFTLELIPDVHRAHRIRNAILMVDPESSTQNRYLRLALAHAWREGVRRFILLLFGKRAPGRKADEVEQELRVLLDSLGDGGAAPCIRTALGRYRQDIDEATRGSMLGLLDAIERVFPPESEDVVPAPLPASFDRECAILDAIRPLIRSSTMIDKRAASLEETAALRDGAGGSHAGGWPYILEDEPWPDCPRCRQPIPCVQQLDTRDVLHATPATHRLHVVYRCSECRTDEVVVRHYDAPRAAGRRPPDPSAPVPDEPCVLVMRRLAHMLPEYHLVEADHRDVIEELRRIDENWGRLYYWSEASMGMSRLRGDDHLGGWLASLFEAHPTCACDAKLELLSTMEHGDWWYSLWACPEHPELARLVFHK